MSGIGGQRWSFEGLYMKSSTSERPQPGDITVTPVRSGYLLGRVVPQRGPGPWWEYVGIEAEIEDAIAVARRLASRDMAKAWLFDGYERYDPLPLEESQPAPVPESPDTDAVYQKAIVRTRSVSAPPSVKASQRSRRR